MMNKFICLVSFTILSIKLSYANPTKPIATLFGEQYSIDGVSQQCLLSFKSSAMNKCLTSLDINRGQMLSSLKELNNQCEVPEDVMQDRTAMINCCSYNDLKNCVSQFTKVNSVIVIFLVRKFYSD